MGAWRHEGSQPKRCVDCLGEMYDGERDTECTTPTPDPASPCGFEGCGVSGWVHGPMQSVGTMPPHPHRPTTCAACGHGIVEAP